jgi:hypothetical protein
VIRTKLGDELDFLEGCVAMEVGETPYRPYVRAILGYTPDLVKETSRDGPTVYILSLQDGTRIKVTIEAER